MNGRLINQFSLLNASHQIQSFWKLGRDRGRRSTRLPAGRYGKLGHRETRSCAGIVRDGN